MTHAWHQDAVFYHIYPLGLCGAPLKQMTNAPIEQRIELLLPWIQHAHQLGANAFYLGPVFQSGSHGYDTIDYYQIDARLGDQYSFARFAECLHQQGMKLVLDGVFNHVGRGFWAFKHVIEHGQRSPFVDWFRDLRFGETSPRGDPFSYQSWHGHFDLVELNLSNPGVREHLFGAVAQWMDQFGVDGLRLDAADSLDFDFMRALNAFTKARREDFWLMGEVVHGDYRDWVNPGMLDSVTNYECYKGLYSSLNDTNYHEIAYSLDRQFGAAGLYQGFSLYNFVDNHDVDRVSSRLNNTKHLYPLYVLLFTMPGIPSIYYGSEWGIEGIKGSHSDDSLRPSLNLETIVGQSLHPDLAVLIKRLSQIRQGSEALRCGNYRNLCVNQQQFCFIRQTDGEDVVVLLNSAEKPAEIEVRLTGSDQVFQDVLNPGHSFQSQGRKLVLTVPPTWGRILTSK